MRYPTTAYVVLLIRLYVLTYNLAMLFVKPWPFDQRTIVLTTRLNNRLVMLDWFFFNILKSLYSVVLVVLKTKANVFQITSYHEGNTDSNKETKHFFSLPPATKLGQGYIFTGVCDSVHGGVSTSVHAGIPPAQTRTPQDQASPLEQTPPGADPLGADPPPPNAEHAVRYG